MTIRFMYDVALLTTSGSRSVSLSMKPGRMSSAIMEITVIIMSGNRALWAYFGMSSGSF